MRKSLNNRFVQGVIFLLFVVLVSWLVAPEPSANLQKAIERLSGEPALSHATVSFLVTDAESGKTVAALNPEVSTVRASAQKLFTTSLALEMLGEDYRPRTRFYADGDITDGVLNGNLWIRGGGDITLGSRYFNEEGEEGAFLEGWAEDLISLGVTSITGRVITDGSAFGYRGAPDGWSWFDLGNYYGAPPSGIALYDNAIRCTFRSGAAEGDPTEIVQVTPEVPELSLRNTVTTRDVKTINVAFYGAPYSYDRMAVGSLPLGRDNVTVRSSMPDPEWHMACEAVRAFRAAGISVGDGPGAVRRDNLPYPVAYDNGMPLLLTHEGPTIKEIVEVTNRESINLFAEQLVCLIGYQHDGEGTTYNGLRRMHHFLEKRMDTTGLHLMDGCGMSRQNTINGRHICDLLNLMYASSYHPVFHNSLAVAGQSGTLANICKNEPGEGRIFAKTGTMRRTKSFIGYVHTESGKKLSFAFTIVNFTCSTWEITEKMEAILNLMASY